MKNILHIAALSLALTASSAMAEDLRTGIADLQINDARSDRPLEGYIWYPTNEIERMQAHQSNGVWQGIQAIEDAKPLSGKHPFVALSHGMYGNARNQNWLAEALVQQGFVVAAIHHPGTSSWMRDPDQARQLWDRPGDISRLIDHVLTDPEMSASINPERIYMAGHSLGGMTAVALAGGRFDAPKMDAFCEEKPSEMVCGLLDLWQVAKTPEDAKAMQADLSDPRIKRFAVFDLGATQTFSTASLNTIARPLLVIGAPKGETDVNLDVESRALRAAVPAEFVTYMEPESLSHFDFLGVCKPGGLAILKLEEPEDAFICEGGVDERKSDHAIVVEAVLAAFQ
ncbi:MAG: alpha/beta hydrolase [Sulfitobacter sp.]